MKICFVALGAYPLFDPSVRGPTGGMEFQSWTFARALAKRGTADVSFLVRDHGQPAITRFDGVAVYARREPLATQLRRVFRGVRRNDAGFESPASRGGGRDLVQAAKLPLRGVRAGLKLIGQALRNVPAGEELYAGIGADVFITFGVNEISAEVISACQQQRRKSILYLASDSDLDEVFAVPHARSREDGVRGVDGHYALMNADAIVVQSQHQLARLSERFGRSGPVIANPIDLDSDGTAGSPAPAAAAAAIGRGPFVLWVGRSDPVYKRPDLCLDLAVRLPQVRFVMVMAPMDRDYHAMLKRRRPANVEIIDGLPLRAMPHLFRAALALVSTSSREGFPNVFLQAGQFGIPVVSLSVDPDGIFSDRGAGVVCKGRLDLMAEAVEQLVEKPERRGHYSHRLANYVTEFHDMERLCDELCEAIDVAAGQRSGAGASSFTPAAESKLCA
jgi:glycosyltransferase involved in cell wall biosynthesis